MADPNSNKQEEGGGGGGAKGGAGEEIKKLDMSEGKMGKSESINKNFAVWKANIFTVKNLAGWKANIFTIGVVISHYVTYYAITINLMDLLTKYWHLSLPKAASTINIQSALTDLSAIMWTFLGDAYFGRYRMVLYSTAFFAFGLGILATSPPSRHLFTAEDRCWGQSTVTECIVSKAKALVLYGSFIFIAVGDGHRPVLKAFGADQFTVHYKDDKKRAKIMLGIWWRSGMIVGGIVAKQVLSEVGGSSLAGYGISAVVKLLALFLFASGTKFYEQVKPSGSPLPNVLRVFVAAVRKGYLQPPEDSNQLYGNTEFPPHTNRFRFLDKACIIEPPYHNSDEQENKWRLCTVTQVEQTKLLLDMLPIWSTFLMYGVVKAMQLTFFLEQASTMNNPFGSISDIILLGFSSISAILISWILEKLKENNLEIPPAISIGVGMIFATLCCRCASYFEAERLKVVKEHGLLDMSPEEFVPMSIFLLLPQFILLGAMDGFTSDSLESFFKDQVPKSMKKFGPSFSDSVTGIGNLLCVILIIGSGKISERRGTTSWFADTINKSRLDYFYQALTVMVYINLCIYALVSRSYKYKKLSNEQEADIDEVV